MQPIIYDVAVSIDGFIAGAGGDVSPFAHDGPVVQDYQERLATYATAIMGRNTYEFGYRFGMNEGDNPYPSMVTYVVSSSIELPKESQVHVLPGCGETELRRLKDTSTGPIYLCGGGDLAGRLLKMRLIDKVVLKRAPVLLGQGTRLFGNTDQVWKLSHLRTKTYENGYVLQEFDLTD